MSAINDTERVNEQYRDPTNLNIRKLIHQKYSTNKAGFGNWIFSNYEIKDNAKVLELGCGTADIWKDKQDIINNISELSLTDISKGMLDSAIESLGKNEKIKYAIVDICEIPYPDHSFDIVIANMMLYHVSDITKALSEVKRVLKTDGKFYCATFGEKGINEYILKLLDEKSVSDKTNKKFTLQNGSDILKSHFGHITKLIYEDALEVTNIDDMIEYINSLSDMSDINNIDKNIIRNKLNSKMINGVLHIPKEYGMFVCENR